MVLQDCICGVRPRLIIAQDTEGRERRDLRSEPSAGPTGSTFSD